MQNVTDLGEILRCDVCGSRRPFSILPAMGERWAFEVRDRRGVGPFSGLTARMTAHSCATSAHFTSSPVDQQASCQRLSVENKWECVSERSRGMMQVKVFVIKSNERSPRDRVMQL